MHTVRLLVVLVVITFLCIRPSLQCPELQRRVVPLPDSYGCSLPPWATTTATTATTTTAAETTTDTAMGACLDYLYTCASRPNAITWSLVDSVTGHYDVQFLLPSLTCMHTNYTIELRVNEAATSPEECETATVADFHTTHSEREFTIENECSSSSEETEYCFPECEEKGLVGFQFLFTSCYEVVITPYVGSNTLQAIHSCPTFITSQYKKQLINELGPLFYPKYLPKDRETHISIKYPPFKCYYLHLTITLMANITGDMSPGKECLSTGVRHSTCVIGSNRTETCERVVCRAELEGDDQISCSFSDVNPGNYCVLLKVSDDRCASNTLWTRNSKTCSWYHPFGTGDSPSTDNPEVLPHGDPGPWYAIAGGALFIIFLLSIVAITLTLKYYMRRRPKQVLTDEPAAESNDRMSPIVLLYARDCSPFMKLMTSFRLLLEDQTMCEVYDVFDDSRWAEQSRNPIEWMRRLISHSDAKIVVVATPCALLRQQAHLDQASIQYQQPHNNDDLFLYALQALTDQLGTDMYQRLFVVRFQGFSDDTDLFQHLNCYTRYVLPVHLDSLLSSLQSKFTDQTSCLIGSEEVQILRQHLTNLIQFKNQNTNYLRNVLSIRRSS